jgi:hypothetical protein
MGNAQSNTLHEAAANNDLPKAQALIRDDHKDVNETDKVGHVFKNCSSKGNSEVHMPFFFGTGQPQVSHSLPATSTYSIVQTMG